MYKTLIALVGAGLLIATVDPAVANGPVRSAAPGAFRGCNADGSCSAQPENHRQYYDEAAGKYYYYDSGTGRYFWEDGRPRS